MSLAWIKPGEQLFESTPARPDPDGGWDILYREGGAMQVRRLHLQDAEGGYLLRDKHGADTVELVAWATCSVLPATKTPEGQPRGPHRRRWRRRSRRPGPGHGAGGTGSAGGNSSGLITGGSGLSGNGSLGTA